MTTNLVYMIHVLVKKANKRYRVCSTSGSNLEVLVSNLGFKAVFNALQMLQFFSGPHENSRRGLKLDYNRCFPYISVFIIPCRDVL
jgi:hypothetical protein